MEKVQGLGLWTKQPLLSSIFLSCFVSLLVLTSFSPSVGSLFQHRGEQPQVKQKTILTYSDVDFPNGSGPYLGHASILWTNHYYQAWSSLRLPISRVFVHLSGLGGGGMSRTYDCKRGIRKACWEKQKS